VGKILQVLRCRIHPKNPSNPYATGLSNLRVMHRRVLAGSLDKQFAGCLEKSLNTNNNKHKSLAAATASSTSLIRLGSRKPASSVADASGTRNNDL
jgi:hypothetical protein